MRRRWWICPTGNLRSYWINTAHATTRGHSNTLPPQAQTVWGGREGGDYAGATRIYAGRTDPISAARRSPQGQWS